MSARRHHFLQKRLNLAPSSQPSDVRIIVELQDGRKEELVVNGKNLSGELLLMLKSMFSIDSLRVVTFPDVDPSPEVLSGATGADPVDQYITEPTTVDVLQYYRSIWDIREDCYTRSKCTKC